MKIQPKNMFSYLVFSYYYIGPVILMTYLMAGRLFIARFSYGVMLFASAFMIYVSWIIYANGIADGMIVIRFFWGFLVFYLVFKSGIRINTDKLLIVLAVVTIVEAVLVNTVILAETMPNYPSDDAAPHFAEPGTYQRPYSFGGSASVTSVILVALLSVSRLGWREKGIVFIAICACMSGSGYLVLTIYFLTKVPPFVLVAIIPALFFLIYSGIIQKISVEYIYFLIDFKLAQIMSELPMNSLLLGIPLVKGVKGLGGDFAFLSFFVFSGFVGVFFLVLVILMNLNKRNWLPLLILIAGTIHYGVLFFLPGQLVFGYFLSLRPELKTLNIRVMHGRKLLI